MVQIKGKRITAWSVRCNFASQQRTLTIRTAELIRGGDIYNANRGSERVIVC